MKYVIIVLSFIFTNIETQGQGRQNLWMHGYYGSAGLSLLYGTNIELINGDTSITVQSRNHSLNLGLANITDDAGNLLFWSNGISVVNKLGLTMDNGDSLNPGVNTNMWLDDGMPIPHCVLILPYLGDTLKYYLLHYTYIPYGQSAFAPQLLYSIVDLSYNNGLGKVISKNNVLLQDSLNIGSMEACMHGNGRDWWIVVHKFLSDKFYKILLSPQGFQIFDQGIGTSTNLREGYSQFSLDGSKYGYYNNDTDVDLFDFDRCDGTLSNWQHAAIYDSMPFGGLCFSPNGNYLYVTSILFAYQYDLTAPIWQYTFDTIAQYDSFYSPQPPLATTFLHPYNGYDGRIYVNCSNGTLHLHRIEFPDKQGDSCMFKQHSILYPTYNALTSPNHPNYHLGPFVGSPCDTLNLTPGPSPKERGVVRVIPNPIKGNILNIEYPVIKNKNNSLKIYDAQGNCVYIRTLPMWSGMHDFPVPNLSPGLYMIQIIDGENRSYGKFCIF